MAQSFIARLTHYALLIRLDKPVGIWLLLAPTLWAIWLASAGQPDFKILAIFVAGVFLMRSAGCAINDIADQAFDAHVQRTRERPLASGKIKNREALFVAAFLALIAFLLVLQCNILTIVLSFPALLLAIIYPFLKRVTHLPQLGLGAAFAFGVPMAFAAVQNTVPFAAWFLFAAAMLWPVIYDTMYAMADREEDLKVGVKSSAIFFGAYDVRVLCVLQIIWLGMLMMVGRLFQLQPIYDVSLMVVAVLFFYQFSLIKDRRPDRSFLAFRNHQWVGGAVFMGIFLSYLT